MNRSELLRIRKSGLWITDLLLFSDPCEKNATVIGIIGKTHGVRTPANPARSEIRKNLSNLLSETGPADSASPALDDAIV